MSTLDPGSPPPGGTGDGGPPDGTGDGPPPGDLPAAEPRGGPTVLRTLLGTQLRRLREESGVTPERAGYEIRASRSKISRLEHGRVSFKRRDVADLLTLYGVTDEQARAGLLSLAEQANAQGWWAKFSDILHLERRSDVDHYLEVMNRLSAEALTPAGTTRFLKEILRET